MSISEESIEEFKKIYKEEFGVDIDDREALERGLALIRLIRAVYDPEYPDRLER